MQNINTLPSKDRFAELISLNNNDLILLKIIIELFVLNRSKCYSVNNIDSLPLISMKSLDPIVGHSVSFKITITFLKIINSELLSKISIFLFG
jgi:hypothetical protein